MCISTIIMADIRNIVIGYQDKYMKTWEELQKIEWLRNRINNYITGIKKMECMELIIKYGDERDKEVLL